MDRVNPDKARYHQVHLGRVRLGDWPLRWFCDATRLPGFAPDVRRSPETPR